MGDEQAERWADAGWGAGCWESRCRWASGPSQTLQTRAGLGAGRPAVQALLPSKAVATISLQSPVSQPKDGMSMGKHPAHPKSSLGP